MKKNKKFKLKKKYKNISSYEELIDLRKCPFKNSVKCPAKILCEQCIANNVDVEKVTDKIEVQLPGEYGTEYKNVLLVPKGNVLNFFAHFFANDYYYSQCDLYMDDVTAKIYATR